MRGMSIAKACSCQVLVSFRDALAIAQWSPRLN
jgi:hypothetical protein